MTVMLLVGLEGCSSNERHLTTVQNPSMTKYISGSSKAFLLITWFIAYSLNSENYWSAPIHGDEMLEANEIRIAIRRS